MWESVVKRWFSLTAAVKTPWWTVLSIKASRSVPNVANSPRHHTATTMFSLHVMFLIFNTVRFNPNEVGHKPVSNIHFCLAIPQSIFPDFWGSSRHFWQCEVGICAVYESAMVDDVWMMVLWSRNVCKSLQTLFFYPYFLS